MSWRSAIAALALASLAAQPAAAHDGQDHGSGVAEPGAAATVVIEPMDPVAEEKARAYFTDLPVVTQDGKELRFFSDVLKDRVVLISLFFTNCKGACPLTTARLAEVQDILGDELGRNFTMISISLDPERDTVPAVKAYADKFEARDGWLFLTGKPENLKEITRRLGHVSANVEEHNTHYFIGNVAEARWVKVRPNAPALGIVEELRRIAGLPVGD